MPTLAEPIPTLDRRTPIVRRVIALALPVLIQQLLIVTVSLSDRWLAGNIKVGTEEVAPALEAVMSGKYPLSRNLFFYTRGKPSGAAGDSNRSTNSS